MVLLDILCMNARQGIDATRPVVWETEDKKTIEREIRALKEAEKELGISGKIIDLNTYLKSGV